MALQFASVQGPRPTQEDRYEIFLYPFCQEQSFVLAVFDGHNGSEAAEYCRKRLKYAFAETVGVSPEEKIRKTVALLNRETVGLQAGTTLSLAYILPVENRVIVAIVGDSPVLVRLAGGLFWLSPLHNVSVNRKEKEAAEKRGGVCYRDGYVRSGEGSRGLQMSRALGDAWIGSIILREPEIHSLKLDSLSWILVMTDGVIDSFHFHDNSHMLHELIILVNNIENDISKIMDWTEGIFCDNATCLLWRS